MQQHKILLSSIDQSMPQCYITLYFVICNGTYSPTQATQKLQRGLDATVQQIPFLRGSIFELNNGQVGVQWSDNGLIPRIEDLGTLSSSSLYAKHLQNSGYTWQAFNKLPNIFGSIGTASTNSIQGSPVLAVQCLQAQDALVLCLSCQHVIMDMTGLCTVLQVWARNTASPSPTKRNIFSEELETRESRLTCSVSHLKHKGILEVASKKTKGSSRTVPIRSEVISLDIEKLNELRSRLRQLNGTNISRLTTVLTLLWSRITLVRAKRKAVAAPVLASQLRLIVDVRKHIFKSEEQRKSYIGNAVTIALCTAGADMIHAGIKSCEAGQLCNIFCTLVHSMTTKMAAESASDVAELVFAPKTEEFIRSVRLDTESLHDESITYSSWSNAPLFVDFGQRVGRVDLVRVAPNHYSAEGFIVELPRKCDGAAQKATDILISLREDDMAALMDDKYFAAYKTCEECSARL